MVKNKELKETLFEHCWFGDLKIDGGWGSKAAMCKEYFHEDPVIASTFNIEFMFNPTSNINDEREEYNQRYDISFTRQALNYFYGMISFVQKNMKENAVWVLNSFSGLESSYNNEDIYRIVIFQEKNKPVKFTLLQGNLKPSFNAPKEIAVEIV